MSVISFQDANALLLYRVGPVLVCSPTLSVESVVMPPKLTATPGSNRAEPGVFKSIHGMVRIVDLRIRFGVDDADRKTPGRIIVVEVEGGRAGFWVDEIEDVIKTPETGWGQLPAYIPRQVFSRTLVGKSDIRLFAEFENLNKFRSIGYLRKHIEKIKATAVIQPAKANADNKRQNTVASSYKQSEKKLAEENKQKIDDVVPEIPVVSATQSANKAVLKAKTSWENKKSPRSSVAPSLKPENISQQKNKPIKIENNTTKYTAKITDQQQSVSRASLPQRELEKKTVVKEEYVTSGLKSETRQEKNQLNASAMSDQPPDYPPDCPKDHSFLWLAAIIMLLLIGFVVLVDIETLMSDENRLTKDMDVNKIKTVEHKSEPMTFRKQPDVADSQNDVLDDEITVMATTGEQSLPKNSKYIDETVAADETGIIAMLDKQQVVKDYAEIGAPAQEAVTGNVVEKSEAGKVIITKNNKNVYIVIDDYDVKDDEAQIMVEPMIEPMIESGSKQGTNKRENSRVSEEKNSDYLDSHADKYTDELETNINETNKSATINNKLVAIEHDQGVLAVVEEKTQKDDAEKIRSEVFESDVMTGKEAPGLLAEAEDEAQKFSNKTGRLDGQSGSVQDENSDNASAVKAETEVVNKIEISTVSRVETGIDVNDDVGDITNDYSRETSGRGGSDSISDSISNSASYYSRDEETLTKAQLSKVDTVATEKTSRRHVHIVVKGDTLWHIAKKYVNNPWRYPELARLSKIKNPDLIYPGNKVIITINYKKKSQNKKSAAEN